MTHSSLINNINQTIKQTSQPMTTERGGGNTNKKEIKHYNYIKMIIGAMIRYEKKLRANRASANRCTTKTINSGLCC